MVALHVLPLREHESASIGPQWDVRRKIVTSRDVAALESIQAGSAGELISIRRRSIKAQQFVGTVSIGQRAIEVLPKIDRDTDTTRRRLVEMLAIARFLPFREAEIAAQASHAATVLDAFMKVYVDHLAFQWRRGRIANYRKQDRNRNCLKGKLLFQDQIRLNHLHPERFFTRCDEFIHDVPPSQLLKAGLHICRRHAVMNNIRRDAMALLMEFDGVSDIRFERPQLDNVSTDRRTDRFEPLIALAKRFVCSQSPDRPGSIQTYSLLFDMNAVFEAYIAALMRRLVCPPRYIGIAQVRGRHLLERGHQPKFRLIPDIGVYERRKLICLIDTKWKLLDASASHEGVSQADMYQMYAYAKEYESPLIILLFPRHTDFQQQVATYRVPPADAASPRIEVCTVDVGRTPYEVAKELRELLENLSPGTSLHHAT